LALKIERRVKRLPKHKKERLVSTGIGIVEMLRGINQHLVKGRKTDADRS
jgi:predicted GIY-YIG superfamily endonuclease